jgi:predicted O-methyltransferase YrrM
MNLIAATYQYLKHRQKAKRWDSFHSPLLFSLFTSCCDDRNDPSSYQQIESRRKQLIGSKETVARIDYGAGSMHVRSGQKQKIASIARHALSSSFQCRFMARLATFTDAKTILEFGSSLGISGAYLAAGNAGAKVVTVEGDPELTIRAEKIFQNLNLKNIQIIQSTFEDYILNESGRLNSIDLLFLDGNHQSQALLTYYHGLKNRYTSNTIIIVDDIYWSKDMQVAWSALIALPEVKQSVDCYYFGLLFFNPDFLDKENHIIKLPWRSVFG